jgi:hypothetical protein
MSREQERIRKKLEQNPIVECNRIQRKYYPTLFSKFSRVKDPRNQSYIDYSVKTMLGTLYYKCIGGISSMQEMSRRFNDDSNCSVGLRIYCADRKKMRQSGNESCSVFFAEKWTPEGVPNRPEETVIIKFNCDFCRNSAKIKYKY